MLLLILGILTIILIACILLKFRVTDGDDFLIFHSALFLSLLWFILLIYVLYLAYTVKTDGYIINESIAMYEEENHNIEAKIEETVESYMKYEADTYSQFKNDSSADATILVNMFPELKTDSVVQQQISIYISNNEKIKELKEQKIKLSKNRWLLYFGK